MHLASGRTMNYSSFTRKTDMNFRFEGSCRYHILTCLTKAAVQSTSFTLNISNFLIFDPNFIKQENMLKN